MSKKFLKTIVIALTCAAIFTAASHAQAEQPADKLTAVQGIKQVEPNMVCMINNTVMDKPQIPVDFRGKTYYGCCEGCASKLKKSQEARTAKDPVTGKNVDKATAYITKATDGSALYFESADTAKRFYSAQKKN
ncbi:MAG: TRASH domain-containing protein [Deltaproteobacteria bacterium]|nr:TRASH domain-containing protein [Deltaproteobacteria bacterium]